MKRTTTFYLIAALIGCVFSAKAQGQAYCDLRDPTRQIYDLFPQATTYRSFVRVVDEQARKQVGELSPISLHFSELGKHTLYLVLQEKRPIGVIHTRSERSQWGLVEIAWALDLDMNVVDFRFQRCRSPQRKQIESDEIRAQIIGKNHDGLLALLDANYQTVRGSRLALASEAHPLATVVIRCGLKTIAATRVIWRQELAVARMMSRLYENYPTAHTAAPITQPYDTTLEERLQTFPGVEHTSIDREYTTMLKAVDVNGNPLGVLLFTRCRFDDATYDIWWTIARESTISNISIASQKQDEITQAVFSELKGLSLAQLQKRQCANAMELIAAEVLVMSSYHLNPEP